MVSSGITHVGIFFGFVGHVGGKTEKQDWDRLTNLEDVKEGTGVQAGLLVNSVDKSRSRLGTLLWEKNAGNVELEALGELVLELELGAESVRGGPDLGGDDTLLVVGVLGLNVGVDDGAIRGTVTGNTEGNTGGGLGLHLEGCTENGVILGEQVIRALAKVL